MRLSIIYFMPLAWVSMICAYFPAQAKAQPDKFIFKNGYGKIISLSNSDAVIDGKHYAAKICSSNYIVCIKYGSHFAIMAPYHCAAIANYKWIGRGVTSFLMAVTPHDDSNVLLSTTYGGWLSFSYGGEDGVTSLYYDSKVKIGVKKIWYSSDYVDTRRVVYNRVGYRKMMSCSK